MTLLRLVAALLVMAGPAFAQGAFPSKPVRIVVPFPAGGSADLLCRIVGDKLAAAWAQPVLIDNRAVFDRAGQAIMAKIMENKNATKTLKITDSPRFATTNAAIPKRLGKQTAE